LNNLPGVVVIPGMKTFPPSVLVALVLLVWPSLVTAQPRFAPGWEEAAVIVYARPDFRGSSLVFYPGEEVPNLGNLRFPDGSRVNQNIISVQVLGRASVLFYEGTRYRGHVLRAVTDIRNLTHRFLPDSPNHWGHRISSLRVERDTRAIRGGESLSPARAEALIHASYRRLFERNADNDGLRHYSRLMLDQGWTIDMIEDSLRESEEYRSSRIDRFIHDAYQEVLRREADPSGLAHYRRLIVERGWDLERVKRDLRRSDEFRRLPYSGR
jgi:hypothetical protein